MLRDLMYFAMRTSSDLSDAANPLINVTIIIRTRSGKIAIEVL